MDNKKTVAIVPGSFDPITNGHMFVINEALKRYDKVYVAVMINSAKEYTFTLEERKSIVGAALEGFDDVEVISSDGWLYDLANELSVDAIVKGYRNAIDLEYEQKMAEFNQRYAPNAETVLIKSDGEISSISSTLVREMLKNEESINKLLPPGAIDKINEILVNKK